MRSKVVTVSSTLLIAGSLWAGATGAAGAQPAPAVREIPQSILLQHEDDISQLTNLGNRPGQLGVAAKKALELLKRHYRREVDYILPPLTLLPILATGKVTPDMNWAIAMADKTKADSEEIFREHTEITDAMNDLLKEAQIAGDKEAIDFAHAAVADSLSDLELQLPMTIVIGDYLRAKLAPAK
jgi:hypothetical protein